MSQFLGVANAPCSWGVLEHEAEESRPEFSTVLDEMAEAEYTGTELGDIGFMPTDPDDLRAELFDRDLALVASFNVVNLSEPELGFIGDQQVLESAQLLADVGGPNSVIVLCDSICTDSMRADYAGRIQPEQAMEQDAWEFAAQTVNQIATQVMDSTGLRTAYHPHCGTYVETPQEIEFLLEVTHPHVVGLCIDTAHYSYGGGDPLHLVRRYGERIWHVHYKGYNANLAAEARIRDTNYYQAIEQGVFSELETSHVDFPAITEALVDVGYDGWIVVEQDVIPGQGTPLESAKRNRDFLKGLGL